MKLTLHFLNFDSLRQMQLEHLEQDGLDFGRLGNTALAANETIEKPIYEGVYLRRQRDFEKPISLTSGHDFPHLTTRP